CSCSTPLFADGAQATATRFDTAATSESAARPVHLRSLTWAATLVLLVPVVSERSAVFVARFLRRLVTETLRLPTLWVTHQERVGYVRALLVIHAPHPGHELRLRRFTAKQIAIQRTNKPVGPIAGLGVVLGTPQDAGYR